MLAPVAFQQFTQSSLEPSLAFDVIHGGHFEHRLLSAMPSNLEHQRFVLGDMVLESGAYDFPVIARGAMPKVALCIGLMAAGAQSTRYNAADIQEDEIQIYPPGCEVLYQAAGKSHWITLVIPQASLQAAAIAKTGQPLTLPLNEAVSVHLPPGRRSQLARLAEDAFAIGRTYESTGLSSALATGVSRGLVDSYVAALNEAKQARNKKRSAVAKQHFQLLLACERLAAADEVPFMELDDIARRSGYSRRALELIFNSTVRMPPGRWFMNIRLNGAMRDLLTAAPNGQVSDIAMRWGFRHAARFAEQYRKAFGELPSQTLQRARQG